MISRIELEQKKIEFWSNLEEFYLLPMCEIPQLDIYSEKSGYAGKAYYYSNKIWLNSAYFLEENKYEIFNTLAHELCHIAQRIVYPKAKQAHGPEFRELMNYLGYDGKTYHYMNVSKAKQKAKNDPFDVLDFE